MGSEMCIRDRPWAPDVVLTENALQEMVATFKGPMPVARDIALLYEATVAAVSPLHIERVEVRRDEHGGAYLAGLVVSPPLSPAFMPTRRNIVTGETHASLVGVAFVRDPIVPKA